MSVSLKVVKSSLLLLGLQLIQRGLGVISTLILARLLTPQDFGVIALITILIQFFELLVDTGNQQYIIQKDRLDDTDLNTAWTMDLAIKTLIAALIIATAHLFASYFNSPDLELAVSIAALALPLRALRTPGMMKLAREINYRPIFKLTLWQKGLSFITVVTVAVIHPSYWAVVLGSLVSALVLAIGSYRVHSFRPKLSLARVREQWLFSQWLILRGIVGFTRSQIDNLIVSKFFGTTALGGYNLVREVSLLPALSIIIPMSEPLLASVAQVKHQEEDLAYRVSLSAALLITILTPVTLFLMMFPELTVGALLGPQWTDYAGLLRPFGLLFFTFGFFAFLSDSIIALGKVKELFIFDTVSTLLIFGLLISFATDSLTTMAWSRGWLAVLTTIALFVLLQRWTGFTTVRFARLLLPVFAGTAIGGFAVTALELPTLSTVPEFLIRGSVFVVITGVATAVGARFLLAQQKEWLHISSIFHELRGNRR